MNLPINKIINIETTNRCPANCIICPRDKYTSKIQDMDVSLFKKIVDDCIQYNTEVFDLCGFGDPFADKYLWDRCKYIKEKLPNSKIYLSTTGYLMTKKHFKNISDYIDILKFSIYGRWKETYEKIHNINYNKSIKNIEDFLAHKYFNYKPEAVYTIGLFVEVEENKQERESWINYWEKQLNEAFVWKPHGWAGLTSQYRKVNYENQKSCGRPLNGPLYIHANGFVSPCCWDINKKLYIGNMNNQTIEEIYYSLEYEYLQKCHKNNNFTGLLCNNCEQTNYDPSVLIYSSNNNRQVGQLTPNMEKL